MSRRRRAAGLALVAVLASGLLAAGTAAARLAARTLVLQSTEVPAGYELQKGSSGDIRAVGAPDVLARPGLVGGYYATYWNTRAGSARTIVSASYVYRSPAGARAALAATEREARRNAPASLAIRQLRIGSGGVLYTAPTKERASAVLWQFDRVLAVLNCGSQLDHETLALALARKQQRRIAAALR